MYIDPNIEQVLKDGLRREGWPKPARAQAADRGGLTRGGITAWNWGTHAGLGRAATAAELNAITETQALEFYHRRYVVGPKFDQVVDQKLRALLVDWSFTSWSDDPIRALQTSLAKRGLYTGSIDGGLGPLTFRALSPLVDRNPKQTYRDVLAARIQFYQALAFDAATDAFLDAHPTSQLNNLRGWVNRCLEFIP